MNRRHLIIALCAGVMLPGAVLAQGFADQIVSQLRSQGYGAITVSNTWLGRTRITAQSGTGSREIIIDPRTGEILRDLFTGTNGGTNGGSSGRGSTNGSGTPQIVDDRSGRDNGENETETETEDGHEDNSGHGNSGDGGESGGEGGDHEDHD